MNDMNDQRPEEQHREGDEKHPDAPPLSAWEVLTSTLAAALGVQSRRNRERDFSRGRASHFIIAGVVFTILFVLGMVLIVNLILSGAA
jgi:hypothetical protein